MKNTRREILKGSLAMAGLGALGVPGWALPLLAQGESVVKFTDMPDTFPLNTTPERRIIDIRTIEGAFTPAGQFFATQHFGHPVIDPAAFRLKVTGLVNQTKSFSLDELRRLGGAELIAGYECSGNRRPLQGLTSNGRWTGVPLRTVLNQVGTKPEAREFVFFGADHGEQEVEFRGNKFKVDQYFGRSLSRERALSPEPFLAYALNGEPVPRHQGAPLRLIVPGWYGVANVKWLSHIHLQADAYVGNYQARWYRTVREETIDGEKKLTETAVTHMNLKSFIARITRDGGGRHKVLGVVLNDGTPIKSVEVSVDGGGWQPATLDPSTRSKYSWKLFTYMWDGATPGEHTLVSRVTDATGAVQPTEKELEHKKSALEDNSQYPRKVMIS
jgi:DMSO/TMAO reductase YedYZ molybdopterin-dependent catalytic subunit